MIVIDYVCTLRKGFKPNGEENRNCMCWEDVVPVGETIILPDSLQVEYSQSLLRMEFTLLYSWIKYRRTG